MGVWEQGDMRVGDNLRGINRYNRFNGCIRYNGYKRFNHLDTFLNGYNRLFYD